MRRRRNGGPEKWGRHRVSQEDIDGMAALRRKGLPLAEVGARFGLSERSARRYVGKVEPRLNLPGPASEETEDDPQALRDRLAREFLDALYRAPRLNSLTVTIHKVGPGAENWEWGGPPSILFMNEADRVIRAALDDLGALALRLLAQDKRSKARFLRERIGWLYWDYVHHHEFVQNLGETGEDWRPPRERPEVEPLEGDDV